MSILPVSRVGALATILIVAMFALFAFGSLMVSYYEGVPSGDSVPADVVQRPFVAVPMLTSFAVGIASFVLSIRAVFRQHDHAVLVYVSFVISSLLVLLLIGEIVFPH